jgi:RimJ/RimL family protein N-acetyltransferase
MGTSEAMSELFPDRIETDRLVLEALSTETVDPLTYYEHASAEYADEVTAHLPWDPHGHPKQSLDDLHEAEEAFETGEHARYVIHPKEDEDGGGELAGTTGIYPKWERQTATFGIWLRPEFWGRGYSGERAGAMIELAFDRLDLDVVAVAHMDGNEKSQRAVEKYVERFGGQHEGLLRNFQANDDGSVVDMHRYTITRDQYDASTAGDGT